MYTGEGARPADADTSPDFEFTFLRPTHQSRTLARPASSYLARPTSPTPPSRPTSPPPVAAAVPSPSQQRALSPKPMRNGAPRLGGLGLGGIVPSEPAPRSRSSSQPRPPAAHARQAAPAVPSAPPPLPERRPSPAAFAPLPADGVPTRPFLSPEMDKPTLRTGVFALDSHPVPDPVGEGKRSRSLTPEGAKVGSGGAALHGEGLASEGGLPSDDLAPEEPSQESEDELEQAAREPEWLQHSPQAERPLGVFALEPSSTAEHGEDDERFADGDSSPSSSVKPAGPVAHPDIDVHESDHSDAEDASFDDARSTTAPSLAELPQATVHEDARAEGPSSGDGEGEQEEVVLDGPSSSTPRSSRAPSEHGDVVQEQPPNDDLDAVSSTSPTRGERVSQPPAPHDVAAALLARADRSTSSAGSHGATEENVNSVVSSPALSRRASSAGSLASEYSTRDQAAELPQPLVDDAVPHRALGDRDEEPPFAPTQQAASALGGPSGEKEERHDAAAVYPSPPSSPTASPGPDLSLTSDTPNPTVPVAEAEVSPGPATAASGEQPLSVSPTSSPVRPSPSTTIPTSPSFNSYEGLGLRLPSSLGRNKRSSFIPPASPPVSPETLEQSLPSLVISDTSLRTGPSPTASTSQDQVGEPKVDKPAQDELSAPRVPVATSPIARDYAQPVSSGSPQPEYAPAPASEASNTREVELPALSDEPAVFSARDVLTAPVFDDGNDELTPASSTSNSPALTARTAASDLEDDDVDDAPLPAPAQLRDSTSRASTPPAATASEPPSAGGPGVVDVGVAVAGALVMGGLAVGTSALRGLAGWAWRSEPTVQAPVSPAETPVVRVESPAEVDGAAERSEARDEVDSKNARSSERAESSVVSTQWGEMEFEAPEDFLDEFKQAMQEIGVAQLEAEDLAAQEAAYLAASRQHDEAVEGEPQPPPSSSSSGTWTPAESVRTLVFPSSASRGSRPPSISGGSVRSSRMARRPLTPADEDEEMDELDRMLAPVWSARSVDYEPRKAPRPAPVASTKYGYAAPPGLTGTTPLSRTLSPPSSTLSRSTPSIASSLSSRAPTTASTKQQPATSSRFGKSLFALGSSSKAPKSPKPAKLTKGRPEYASSPPSSPKVKVKAPPSAKSLSSIEEDGRSAYTSASHKPPSRRRSFVSFGSGGGGGSNQPVTSIESRIADTTYVHYGSSAPKSKRRDSAASLAADLYASRDPVLIPGVPASPSVITSLLPPGTAGVSSSSNPRRSCLKAPAGESKLYRVRFANATRGLGLRSVAEDEAERGGDDVALKWIGVGRGRYGNLTIKEGEDMDVLYETQVKSIKGKWRSFGSEQSRDWSNVRVD